MKKILTIILYFVFTNAFSQSNFHKRYGTAFIDQPKKIITLSDGNYLIVGYTYAFGSASNAFIMKIDNTGKILWVKDFAGINDDVINDIIELPNSHLMMVGNTSSYGAGATDAFIMEMDNNCNMIWSKIYGGIASEGFERILKADVNNFYVSGWVDITSGSLWGTALLKIDNLGNILWSHWVNDNLITREANIATLNNNELILGNRTSPNNCFSLWKFDSSGNLKWSNKYTPNPSGSGLFNLSILEKNSNEIVIATSCTNTNTVVQNVDVILYTLDSNGIFIHGKSIGGTYIDEVQKIYKNNLNELSIVGTTNSAGNGTNDIFLIKLNVNDSVQFAKAYGTSWKEMPIDFIPESNGYILLGQTYTVGTSLDSAKIYVVKTDINGNTPCNTISWIPIENPQSINTTSTFPSNQLSLTEGSFNWSANTRGFYEYDMCNHLTTSGINYISNDKIVTYPNPCRDLLFFNSNGKGFIKVFSISGTLLLNEKITSNKNSINTSKLNVGIYLLELNIDGKVYHQKFIKA